MDLISIAISVAMYVMQGLSLQCIARRRGIRHDWLAWVPVGSVWVLGAIADDYRRRTRGNDPRLRVWTSSLLAVLALVLVAVFFLMGTKLLPIMTKAVSEEELIAYSDALYYGQEDLYSEDPEVLMEQMTANIEEKLTEEDVQQLMSATLLLAAGLLVMSGVMLAVTVLEAICQYRLYASCDPQYKVLFLVLSLWLGTGPVCMFLCRHKDLGMPPVFPGLPGGPGPENGWQPPQQDPPAWPM